MVDTKYVFITGGVVSGLGKGICAASLGRLLKQRGLRVTLQKLEPYINVDSGTMSPYQHGEVFVTEDGFEADVDLGHYERFIDENLTKKSSSTSGEIYWSILNRERNGDYLGHTIQVVPHIIDEIKSRIFALAENVDVVISEIGGTVGDIEIQPFLEAIRQVAIECGRENVVFIHLSLIVQISDSDELKTKPTQASVKELLSRGIQPDILVCRTGKPITQDIRSKISLHCNMTQDYVIQNVTATSIYEVPLLLAKEGLDRAVCRKLNLDLPDPDLSEWASIVDCGKTATLQTQIALVGKYTELRDAYISVAEALSHAGFALSATVEIRWVDSESITKDSLNNLFSGVNGIIVPSGFGSRGTNGMILTAEYARKNNIPFFGIGLGMHMAVVEFARNVAGIQNANSTEVSKDTKCPVIDLMPEQIGVTQKGGTMRLGSYPCVLTSGSKVAKLYGANEIQERHRHRYEFNTAFCEQLGQSGLVFSGRSLDDEQRVEIIELPEHSWFVGVQFQPEMKSRPNRIHPLFYGFVKATLS